MVTSAPWLARALTVEVSASATAVLGDARVSRAPRVASVITAEPGALEPTVQKTVPDSIVLWDAKG
jgi:hypothetical protein